MGFAPGSANREDLLDFITNVDPWETPMFTSFPKTSCNHVTHEWLTDTLAAAASGGACEGADFIASDVGSRTRGQNVTQIFRKDLKVTNTQRAVNPAGIRDEYAYQIQKGLKELARNIEKQLVANSALSASGATAEMRIMKALSDFYATGIVTSQTMYAAPMCYGGLVSSAEGGVSAPWAIEGLSSHCATVMSEDRFNGILEQIFAQGGNPDQVFVSAPTKRQISAFSGQGASRRNVAMTEKKLIASVDVYDSDFGMIHVILDRWVPKSTGNVNGSTSVMNADLSGQVYFLESGFNRLAFLRPFRHVPLAPVGDATRGMIAGELTLEVLTPKTGMRLMGAAETPV